MIDKRGYRLNIGIVLANEKKQLFWGKRISVYQKEVWQFPQGGICAYETLKEAMYRELLEETGLMPKDIKIMQITQHWLHYKLPYTKQNKKKSTNAIYYSKRPCIGQKQKWFLLKLISDQTQIRFDQSKFPEFSDWRWVDYWYPLQNIVSFKRYVYEKVLKEFEPSLFSTN